MTLVRTQPTATATFPALRAQKKFRVSPGLTLHIQIVGQSLSVGANASSADTTLFPGWMFSNGVNAGTSLSRNGSNTAVRLSSAVDLVRTIAQSASTRLVNLSGQQYFFSGAGEVGFAYSAIKKGTTPYTSSITQIGKVSTALSVVGRTTSLAALVMIHGESDAQVPFYSEYLREHLTNYRTDLGRSDLKLFYCQPSSWTKNNSIATPFSGSPIGQFKRHEDDPTNYILVCPKYFLPYADGIHITAAGQEQLGEYYANAIHKVLNLGQSYSPLRPTSITATGSGSDYTITAVFNVPDSGNLVLDTTLVSNPGNYGFEVIGQDRTLCTVSSVSVSGQTATIVTSSGVPVALRYAFTGTVNNNAGPTTGARGNLRGDTTIPSNLGYTNYHWCVTFDKAISNSGYTAPTSPATTNLVGYWDASNGVTLSGSKVTDWAARFTSEASTPSFTQATDANRFTFASNQINSLPALTSSGTARMVATLAASATTTTGVAVFWVAKVNTATSAFNYFVAGADSATTSAASSGNTFIAGYKSNGTVLYSYQSVTTRWRGSDFGSNPTYKFITDDWAIYSMRVKSSVIYLYCNGKLIQSGAVASNSNTIDKLAIGVDFNAGNSGFNGSLGAIAVYKDGLSDADFWQTSNYLAATFNIAYGYQ